MTPPPPRIAADWLARPATQAVFAALAAHGHPARVVGGAVRNALLGRPVSDIDIATPARPEQVIAAATAAGLAVVPTGLQHGTVTVISERIPHEVTTLRRDVETDGRHAVVAFTGDWAADAARRDFTINALYCDATGRVHDPLGGYDDLVARRVRFIGDAEARICEDYLRILRFFRFTAEYADGPADSIGLAACGRLRTGLERLSADRIRTELLKILLAPRAAEMADLMFAHGFWVPLLGLAPVPPHLSNLVAAAPAGTAMHRLAALCIATPDDARRLAARLRLSNSEATVLDRAAMLVPRLTPSTQPSEIRALLYRVAAPDVLGALAIARARLAETVADARWTTLQAIAAQWPRPALPVRGQDLIDAGMPPGPALGAALADLEAWWIAEDFAPDRAALLARLQKSRTRSVSEPDAPNMGNRP